MSVKPGSSKNYIVGYMGFLHRWESREELHKHKMQFAKGLGGSINLTGEADCFSSYLLTRWHPSFYESIEPGVKELVEQLICTWDCVTYSSCEGHRSTSTNPLQIRNVRIGTRSRSEHVKLIEIFSTLSRKVNETLNIEGVLLKSRESSANLEEGFDAPGVDLLFLQSSDEDAYWRDIEYVYREALKAINNLSAAL